MQNGSTQGHPKCQENDPKNSTRKMGKKMQAAKSHSKQYDHLWNSSQKEVNQRCHLQFMVR
jgi:hypothetical protein